MSAKTATATNLPVEQHEHRSVLRAMADRYEMEPKAFEATLRSTVVPGNCSREQFAAFLVVANEYNLNPLTKEIYAFPAKGGGIQPIVSIDGWANLINSHPAFDGMEFKDALDAGGGVISITCEMHRKDRTRSISATEYMAECKRSTEPWQRWPRRMLRHKAMIQAARYAFGFAGIIDPDEHDRFSGSQARDVTPRARVTTINDALEEFARPQLGHDLSTGETVQADSLDDSPGDDKPDASEAKPADAAMPDTATKPASTGKGKTSAAKKVEAEPSAAPPPAANEPTAASESSPDTVGMDLGPADTLPDSIMDDPGIDHDANRWEPGQPPTTVDQYENHFAYQMEQASTYDEVTKAFTADAGLRNAIGITEDEKEGYTARAKARREELKAR